MRKQLIALCVAAALTAPMIAQADANLFMAQPALFFQYEVSQTQPVTLTAEASTVIENRSFMPQLEAAVIMASKSKQWPDGSGIVKLADERIALGDGPIEVGWRS